MFHLEQSNKVSSSHISKRQETKSSLIGLKCVEKNSNHASKNILESKLLPWPLTDKINLSVVEEALKVKVG